MAPYSTRVLETLMVIELPQRIDSVTSEEFEKNLHPLIKDNSIILCDFSQNTYISSLGLRILLSTMKTMKKTGGTLALFALSPYVQEIFDISGFSKIFPIYLTEQAAVDDLIHNNLSSNAIPRSN